MVAAASLIYKSFTEILEIVGCVRAKVTVEDSVDTRYCVLPAWLVTFTAAFTV